VLVKATINPLRAVVAPERFEAVARSEEYAQLMRREPSAAAAIAEGGCSSMFALIFVLVSGGMGIASLPFAGPLAIVPLGMCGFGIFMLIAQSRKTARLASSPTERLIAVWRDERTEVSGGGENSSATTRHFVLLEVRGGKRKEFSCSLKLSGAHAPGDIGVAYLRDEVLLDFQRVNV